MNTSYYHLSMIPESWILEITLFTFFEKILLLRSRYISRSRYHARIISLSAQVPVQFATHPEEVPGGAVQQSAVLHLRLRGQVLRRIDRRDHALHGEEGGQVGRVRGDEYQGEEEPRGGCNASGHGPRRQIASLLHEGSQREPEGVPHAELIHRRGGWASRSGTSGGKGGLQGSCAGCRLGARSGWSGRCRQGGTSDDAGRLLIGKLFVMCMRIWKSKQAEMGAGTEPCELATKRNRRRQTQSANAQ